MVLAMLRCSVVGKWTGGAVGAEKGKLIGDYKVLGTLDAGSLDCEEFSSTTSPHYIPVAQLNLRHFRNP
jgi:hypothetical protein